MTTLRRIDVWLCGYLLILAAALAITSVGTYIFFGAVLAPALAVAATAVLAVGIPLLKIGGVLQGRRTPNVLLWTFVGIELVAQYFKAQAGFARSIAAQPQLAASDLAAAANDPVLSRALAFLFLASLPLVVVAMCDRVAQRLLARRLAGGLRRFARLRRVFAALRAERGSLRGQLAPMVAALAASRAEAAQYARTAALCEARLADERSRPVLTLDALVDLMIDAGAPEATVRGWRATNRLRQPAALTDRSEAR